MASASIRTRRRVSGARRAQDTLLCKWRTHRRHKRKRRSRGVGPHAERKACQPLHRVIGTCTHNALRESPSQKVSSWKSSLQPQRPPRQAPRLPCQPCLRVRAASSIRRCNRKQHLATRRGGLRSPRTPARRGGTQRAGAPLARRLRRRPYQLRWRCRWHARGTPVSRR